MGERPIWEVTQRLIAGEPISRIRDVRGIAWVMSAAEADATLAWPSEPPGDGRALELPSHEEVSQPTTESKDRYAQMARLFHYETTPTTRAHSSSATRSIPVAARPRARQPENHLLAQPSPKEPRRMSEKRRQDLVSPPDPEAQREQTNEGRRSEAQVLAVTGRLFSRLSLIRHDEEAILQLLQGVPRTDRFHARIALFQALGGQYTNACPRALALCEKVFGSGTMSFPGEREILAETAPPSPTTPTAAPRPEPEPASSLTPEATLDQGRTETLAALLQRQVSQPPFPPASELLALLDAAESHVARAALSRLNNTPLPGEDRYGKTYYQALQEVAGEKDVSFHISGQREEMEQRLPWRYKAGWLKNPPLLPPETSLLHHGGQLGAGHLLGSWDKSLTKEAKAQHQAEAEQRLAEGHPALGVLGQGGGEPLPGAVLARMNRLLGHDFSHVRIHTDARAAQATELLGARALAFGTHLYFGAGQFAPGTTAGDRLLAHELIHVVQFDQGRLPALRGAGVEVSRPEDSAEQEAEARTQHLNDASHRSAGQTDVYVGSLESHVVTDRSTSTMAAMQAPDATRATILRDGPDDPHASVDTIPVGGTRVGRVGIVAWDGEPALRLRSSASTSADNVIAPLAFNTTLQVIKEFPGGWYFVSTQGGLLGYAAKAYIKTNLPDPNAKLHRVEDGRPGFAISIAERYYRQHAQDWGQDLRFYVNVLAWVNNRPVPNTATGWRDLHFNAGEFLWIPSHGFAQTLRGIINSGSISHNIAESIGIADFLDRTEELYRDIDTAIRLSGQYLLDAIGRHVEAALLGVLESLAWMMALAAGVLAVSTAIGAGLGLLAGGAGAAPGAALGFEVGMALLQWLGLAMLVVWIGQSLVRVGAAFGTFLVMVWNARGNRAQLDRAARQFAEGIGILCGVLLEGLVMWAVSIGATRAINGLRGTRFGRSFNNSETGRWLNERVRRVQAGESPLPTPRAVIERLIRGVELIDGQNSPLGEFDGIDMAGRRFIENKAATGIDRPNPRTGLPQQTPAQWAARQITTKTTNRIRALANAVATRGPAGTPSLVELRGFRHIHFMIDGTSPALQAAVFAELANLRSAHPGWTFTVEFGVNIVIPPVPTAGDPEQ